MIYMDKESMEALRDIEIARAEYFTKEGNKKLFIAAMIFMIIVSIMFVAWVQ